MICERLHGGSIKVCECRLFDDLGNPMGWLPCPPEAPRARRAIPEPAGFGRAAAVAVRAQTQPEYAKAIQSPMMSGELCREPGCGGFLVRTGSCMTCQACGANEGCG
jgi:hypothetical protein